MESSIWPVNLWGEGRGVKSTIIYQKDGTSEQAYLHIADVL
jgi:hypothetical protein